MSGFSALNVITRRFSTFSLAKSASTSTTAVRSFQSFAASHNITRNASNIRLNINNSIPKTLSGSRFFSASPGGSVGKKNDENSENAEWVKFQQSIQVQGFDTGLQTTLSATSGQFGKKRRGGKRLRKKEEKLRQKLYGSPEEKVQLGGGHFPALRYSEEETARLLAEAYDAIPPRAGKRGTKNLKRQKVRFHFIRKRAAQKKRERIAAHFRKMEKRSQKVKDIQAVYEKAPEAKEAERDYQQSILERWSNALKLAEAEEK